MPGKQISKGVHIIVPINYLTVDCGNCKGRVWEIKILPQGKNGKIMAIVCAKCRNTLKVSNDGFIDGKDGVISEDQLTLFKPKGTKSDA